MNEADACRFECENLMVSYVHHLDNGNGDGVAALFAEDGVWDRQGKIIKGRESLRKAVSGIAPGVVMRHVTSNFVVEIVDRDHAAGSAYFISYRDEGTGPVGHALPRPLVAAAFVGDYEFKFAKTPEGWRITFHKAHRVFENESFVDGARAQIKG